MYGCVCQTKSDKPAGSLCPQGVLRKHLRDPDPIKEPNAYRVTSLTAAHKSQELLGHQHPGESLLSHQQEWIGAIQSRSPSLRQCGLFFQRVETGPWLWCNHSGSSWKALALPMCDVDQGNSPWLVEQMAGLSPSGWRLFAT